jgi:hypothetical protein
VTHHEERTDAGEPQTPAGKVLWHPTTSLDGFVAGPDHTMDWMTGTTFRPGLVEECPGTTGAVLGGRAGWDARAAGAAHREGPRGRGERAVPADACR